MARKDLKSLKISNQICFFILKNCRLSLQRQSKKWKAWESHMLGTSKKGKNPKFKDLKIFENLEFLLCWELFFVGSKQRECLELRKKKLVTWEIVKFYLLEISASGAWYSWAVFLLSPRENIIRAKCVFSISQTSRRSLFKGCNVGRVQVIERKDIKGSKSLWYFPKYAIL